MARNQSFCAWKSTGSTGNGGLGPYYLTPFMREQSGTVVAWRPASLFVSGRTSGRSERTTDGRYHHARKQRRRPAPTGQGLLTLDRSIDKEQVGPKQLELLREQASLSDKLEALRSTRV